MSLLDEKEQILNRVGQNVFKPTTKNRRLLIRICYKLSFAHGDRNSPYSHRILHFIRTTSRCLFRRGRPLHHR